MTFNSREKNVKEQRNEKELVVYSVPISQEASPFYISNACRKIRKE